MKTQLALSQALAGYLLDAEARRLSPHTIADYMLAFTRFQDYLRDDPPITAIRSDDVRGFLSELDEIAGRPISAKQVLNHHTALSALWTWCLRNGYTGEHILRTVSRPRPDQHAVIPFSQDDLRALLAACERSRPYARFGKRLCDNARPTATRDRAIILLLVDTGLRATELCELRIQSVDLRNRRIVVFGKGRKERQLPIGPSTGKALWRYLQEDRPAAGPADSVFVSTIGHPLDRGALRQLLARLGEKAGVADCHPHRFRHTFAVAYLRNGGNALALQALLGHATLEMVRRYVQIAELDLVNSHRTASPVENWRL